VTRHLLVIGGQRCGTTWLHDQLDAHPDIAMARPARPEPKVFLSEQPAGRGLDSYRATFFAHATGESLLGEKSTSYLEDAAAPARAAAVLGAADIVVQLRDPVARAVSNWRFSAAHGLEERPLAEALEENLHGPREWDPTRTSVSPYAYLERGHYLDHLEPWYASFPDRVHVRFLEGGCLEGGVPHRTSLASLYAALGVDPTFRPVGLNLRVNTSSGSAPQLEPALVRRLREHYLDSDTRLARHLREPLPWPVA